MYLRMSEQQKTVNLELKLVGRLTLQDTYTGVLEIAIPKIIRTDAGYFVVKESDTQTVQLPVLRLPDEVASVLEEYERLRAEVEKLKFEKAALEDTKSLLVKQIEELQKKVEELESIRQSLEEEKRLIEEEKKRLEEELNKYKQQYEALKREHDELKRKYSELLSKLSGKTKTAQTKLTEFVKSEQKPETKPEGETESKPQEKSREVNIEEILHKLETEHVVYEPREDVQKIVIEAAKQRGLEVEVQDRVWLKLVRKVTDTENPTQG